MMNFGQSFGFGQSLSANDHPLQHNFPEPDLNQSSFSSSTLQQMTPSKLTDLNASTDQNYFFSNVDAPPQHFVSSYASSSTTSVVFGGSRSLLPIDSFHGVGVSLGGSHSSTTTPTRFQRQNLRRPLCNVDITANPLPEDIGVVQHAARLLALFIECGEVVERWTPSEPIISPCECPPGAIAVGAELPMVLRSSIAGAGALVMLKSILNPEDGNVYQIAMDHPMVSHPFFPPIEQERRSFSTASHVDAYIVSVTPTTDRKRSSKSKRQFEALCEMMDMEYQDSSMSDFLCGLLANVKCTWETYIITLALFYRVSRLTSPPSSSSGVTKVLLLGCYVLAVKSRDDQPYTLSYYAKGIGLSTSEMLQIELCVWQLLDYNASVSCDDYITTLFSLRTFCSNRVHLDEESWFQDAWGEMLSHVPLPSMSDLSREIISSIHDEAIDVHNRQHCHNNNNNNTKQHFINASDDKGLSQTGFTMTLQYDDMVKSCSSISPDLMQTTNGIVPVWQVSHLECYCPHHNHHDQQPQYNNRSSSRNEIVIDVDAHDS